MIYTGVFTKTLSGLLNSNLPELTQAHAHVQFEPDLMLIYNKKVTDTTGRHVIHEILGDNSTVFLADRRAVIGNDPLHGQYVECYKGGTAYALRGVGHKAARDVKAFINSARGTIPTT